MLTKKRKTNVPGFLYWAPRVGTILFLVFLALFSLDIFEENYGFWGTIVGLLMHNIPVFFLLLILVISWKYEIVGGVVFTVASLLYIGMWWNNMAMHPGQPGVLLGSMIIAGPALVIGVLFLINWFKKKRKEQR